MVSQDILTLPPPPADARLRYGPEPAQFGDLRLPRKNVLPPLVMMIHGGFWRARYDLSHAGHLCGALTALGLATFNTEYRRVGDAGGGWPGTFEDIRSAYAYLRQHASTRRFDSAKMLIMGHSAGGQLALCLAGHERSVTRCLSLAGVADLERAFELHLSNDAVVEFLGGKPDQVPEHYQEASPIDLAMPYATQYLLHGQGDQVVPIDISRRYAQRKKSVGEGVVLREIPKADHFAVIDPRSQAWTAVQEAVLQALG